MRELEVGLVREDGTLQLVGSVGSGMSEDERSVWHKKLSAIEEDIYQVRNRSNQDPLNFPIKLNNKLAALLSVVQNSDTAPTAQSNQVFEDLATRANGQLRRLDTLVGNGLTSFNKLVHDTAVPAVILKEK